MNNLKNELLCFLNSQSCAVSKKEIEKSLNVSNVKELDKSISELEDEAKLIVTKKGKLILPKTAGFVPSRVVAYKNGFIFVSPIFGGEDIYIPIEKAKKAMLHDIVMVNRIKAGKRGLSGAVERIVKEGKRFVTGQIKRSRKGIEFWADSGYKCAIPIKKNKSKGAREGKKVLVRLYTEKESNRIFGKVLKIYGDSQTAMVCVDAIIDNAEIPVEFSKESMDLAKSISNLGIREEDYKGRLDLREENIFTIDGADAKDLDDAISIKKENNDWLLGVHIADVSHYIQMNSPLDVEARERGTSVYFADRVIPMLPKEISNGICSLNSGEDRLAFSALIRIDKKGNIRNFEFRKSVINSKVRGVYSEVNDILEGKNDRRIEEKYAPVKDSIFLAKELADILSNKAKHRGCLELNTTEPRFTLDKNGVCIDVNLRSQGASEEIIEQFMITANIAAAIYAKGALIPFIYRVHEPPAPEKIVMLAQLVSELGLKANRIRQGMKSSAVARLIRDVKGTKVDRVVSNQVLRTMSKARYFSEPLGHFGLSLEDYCHFTSPIRRYPDTTIHRILNDLVSGIPLNEIENKYKNIVKEVSEESTECEIRAMRTERDAEKCYMAEYMMSHVGETFDGVISGVVKTGVFVELKNGIEGFIGIEYFDGNNYKYNGITSLTDENAGVSITVGDPLRVKVINADVSTGLIDFMPGEYLK